MTTISVIVPARNDARMLEHCLDALARQRRPADEIIVVDNDSSDETSAVAARSGATVLSEKQVGIWRAAASGFDAASGDILARCDADSRPGIDWLARIERVLAENPDAIAVSGPGRFYDLRQPFRFLADLLYTRAYFWLARGALANRTVFGSNLALRATVWRDVASTVHRNDPGVHDDFDLAYHFDPAATVLFDAGLDVGISARPFRDKRAMLVRLRRGVHTVTVHGLAEQPTLRWRRRITARHQRKVAR